MTRQLSERVALGIGGFAEQATGCVNPDCDWRSRAASGFVSVGVRPLSWLTVRVIPDVGVRERPDIPLPTMYPNGTPITIQPLRVWWVALTGLLEFYW